MKRLLTIMCASALGVAVATDYTYSVSDATELVTALADVNAKAAARDTYVVTLSEGTYDLSTVSAMANEGLLAATNKASTSAKLTLQGDPSLTRDKVVIDTKQLGRTLHIYWENGITTIRNITFKNGKFGGHGGAVRVERFCKTVVTNCAFICNVGNGRGGAVYGNNDAHIFDCQFLTNMLVGGTSGGGAGANNAKEVVGCTFIGNSNAGDNQYGGALNGITTVLDCTFTDNCATGRWGFAGALYGGSMVSNCTFTGNYTGGTSQHGGAIYSTGGIKILDCAFTNNHATAGNNSGGAVYATNINAEVRNCLFTSNSISGSNSRGGGVYSTHSLLSNCTFVGNSAYRGGGVHSCNNVRDCVFAGNRANINSGEEGGGAAYSATLYGCVVTNNVGQYKNGGLYNCKAYDSLIGGNHSAVNYSSRIQEAESTSFDGCTLFGADDGIDDCYILFKNCSFNRCEFRGCKANYSLFIGDVCVTNSLFVSNKAERVFQGTTVTNGFVNNTLVDNTYNNFVTSVGAGSSIQVMNCLFTGTRPYTGATADDVGTVYAAVVYSNNFIRTSKSITGGNNLNAYTDVSLTPNLMGARDPEHPYSPRLHSPLVGAGLVMDWMADAMDLVGNPRLRDGKVDIGCYECWLNPMGFSFSIR